VNAYGHWVVGLAVAYTALLVVAGRVARRRAQGGAGNYFVGGRQFSPLLVAVCITGLFSGSTFIAVLELSYLKGVSAAWYGVAETLQVLLIGLLLVASFRERGLVTISGLIGDRYGRGARAVAGAITAFAFPMWSVATALAFASAVHVSTGIPMIWSLVLTAVLLLAYLQGGGMWSIGLTQSINCLVFIIMLAIGVYALFASPGIGGFTELAETHPEFYAADTVGMTQIVAWFGTFIINVPLAQAAFQMAVSLPSTCRGTQRLVLGVPNGRAVRHSRDLVGIGRSLCRTGCRQRPDRHSAISGDRVAGAASWHVLPRHLGLRPGMGRPLPILRRYFARTRCHDGGATTVE
jgi:solute:Na+ symporter, SSS family